LTRVIALRLNAALEQAGQRIRRCPTLRLWGLDMKTGTRIGALATVFLVLATSWPQAATISIGGIRLRLPGVSVQRRSRTYSSVYAHPRWGVTIQDGWTFATNGMGIWIGHDETGEMVMQVEAPTGLIGDVGTTIPIVLDVNGQLFASVPGKVASANLALVHGIDVERLLSRLQSGRTLRAVIGPNIIETHLSGSSSAIGAVRRAALAQRILFASGAVQVRDKPGTDAIRYFAPGSAATGATEVRFDIVEGTGLVLYANFDKIQGNNDPAYSIPFTEEEARRIASSVEKAKEWTDVAVKNRVGLFTKRIAFIDDINAGGGAQIETAELSSEDRGLSVQPNKQGSDAAARSEDPRDFKAVNFNSYEDGTTSVQLEHAVAGFSRRFNLSMENAEKLAKSLEQTIEYARQRLEKRDLGSQSKDDLFK